MKVIVCSCDKIGHQAGGYVWLCAFHDRPHGVKGGPWKTQDIGFLDNFVLHVLDIGPYCPGCRDAILVVLCCYPYYLSKSPQSAQDMCIPCASEGRPLLQRNWDDERRAYDAEALKIDRGACAVACGGQVQCFSTWLPTQQPPPRPPAYSRPRGILSKMPPEMIPIDGEQKKRVVSYYLVFALPGRAPRHAQPCP